jgi:hypothetical protein
MFAMRGIANNLIDTLFTENAAPVHEPNLSKILFVKNPDLKTLQDFFDTAQIALSK